MADGDSRSFVSKRCQKCLLELPLSLFGKFSSASDGLMPCCRECRNASRRASNVPRPLIESTKRCTQCGDTQSTTQFSWAKVGNYRSRCKSCDSVDALAYYEAHRQMGPPLPQIICRMPKGIAGTKCCSKCGENKSHDSFKTNKKQCDGLHPSCRECVKAQQDSYYQANKEKLREAKRRFYIDNPETVRRWTEKQKGKPRKRRRETDAAYRETERCKAGKRAWNKRNPGKTYANKRLRMSREMQATPSWADPVAICALYMESATLSRDTGVKHNVDHIVPVRSKLVCGLHVEANLRITTQTENYRKGNRHWPDMP